MRTCKGCGVTDDLIDGDDDWCPLCGNCTLCCDCDPDELYDADELGLDPETDDARRYRSN